MDLAVAHPEFLRHLGTTERPPSWPHPVHGAEAYDAFTAFVDTLEAHGVSVYPWCPAVPPDGHFVRDVAVVIGDVLQWVRPAGHRRWEPAAYLAHAAHPLKERPWTGPGTMEGADVLCMAPRVYSISVGYRTTPDAAEWLAAQYPEYEWHIIQRTGPPIPQHALGGHRVIGGTMFCRTDAERLPWPGPKVMLTPDDEIVKRYAMNWCALGPHSVLLADDTPNMARTLRQRGVVVYTADMAPLRAMGGGFACMTLPLSYPASNPCHG